MSERELFEKHVHPKMMSWVYFCDDVNSYIFKIVTCDADKVRALAELNFGWKIWQEQQKKIDSLLDAVCGTHEDFIK